MPIQFDTQSDPIIWIHFAGAVTEREFDTYLETMTRYVNRGTPTLFLYDALQSQVPSATQRQKQAAWLERHEAALRRNSLGTAFVIANPLIRGALTAIFWIRPTPVPYIVTGTRSEAERWARGLVAGEARRSA